MISNQEAFGDLQARIGREGRYFTKAQFLDVIGGQFDVGRCVEGREAVGISDGGQWIEGSIAVRACLFDDETVATKLGLEGARWATWSQLIFELTEPLDESPVGHYVVTCLRGFRADEPRRMDEVFALDPAERSSVPDSSLTKLAPVCVAPLKRTRERVTDDDGLSKVVEKTEPGLMPDRLLTSIREDYTRATGLLLPDVEGSFGPKALPGVVAWMKGHSHKTQKAVKLPPKGNAYIR